MAVALESRMGIGSTLDTSLSIIDGDADNPAKEALTALEALSA